MTLFEATQTDTWFQYNDFLRETAKEKGVAWWSCLFELDKNLWVDDFKKKFRDYIKTEDEKEIYQLWVEDLKDDTNFKKEVNELIETLKQL